MSTRSTRASTQQPPRSKLLKRADEEAVVEDIPQHTPVGAVIHHYARQTRFRVGNDIVERRARHLQEQNSYEDWLSLSDRDRELWRHIARMQLEDVAPHDSGGISSSSHLPRSGEPRGEG